MKSLLFKYEDFESLNWKDHPVFKNGLQTKYFFENGYGISIITNKTNSNEDDLTLKDKYELGILRGNKAKHEFISIEDLKNVDPDYEKYEYLGGIWTDCDVDKVIQKINIVATL